MRLSDLIPFYHHHDQLPEGVGEGANPFLSGETVFTDIAMDAEMAGAFANLGPWLEDLQVEVETTDREVVVSAEVPGIAIEDLEIRLEAHGLRLRRRSPRSDDGADRVGWCAPFERFVPLPCPVEGTQAEASVHGGLLTVRLPRTPVSVPMSIPVKAA